LAVSGRGAPTAYPCPCPYQYTGFDNWADYTGRIIVLIDRSGGSENAA